MINLTEEDKNILRHLGFVKLCHLSFGDYYVKSVYKEEAIKELLGKEIANIFKINAPTIKVIQFEDDYYVLSEDLNKQGKFKTINDYGINVLFTNFYDIWNFFEKNSEINVNMLDVIKTYIIDLLFSNYDRRTVNWGILTKTNKEQIVTIIDNEFLISDDKDLALYTSDGASIYDDFEKFLKESSSEYILLFKKYYDIFTPGFVLQLLNKVEIDNNIIFNNDILLKKYKIHYEELGHIYNKYINRGDCVAR